MLFLMRPASYMILLLPFFQCPRVLFLKLPSFHGQTGNDSNMIHLHVVSFDKLHINMHFCINTFLQTELGC